MLILFAPILSIFFKLSVTSNDLLELADRFGWSSVTELAAELCVRKVARDCWDVTGQITAQVIQNCIVTDVLVPESVDFQIEERYVRSIDEANDVEVRLDAAEPLKNGAIDIGELAVQSLGLAASAWPRVENAPDCYNAGDHAFEHPFAGLSALKRQDQE
jgi:uncharacterized metal-binding protein YceD (DUF177 family)